MRNDQPNDTERMQDHATNWNTIARQRDARYEVMQTILKQPWRCPTCGTARLTEPICPKCRSARIVECA